MLIITGRKHNKITALQDQNGEWVQEHNEIVLISNNYYNNLFNFTKLEESIMKNFLKEPDTTLSEKNEDPIR